MTTPAVIVAAVALVCCVASATPDTRTASTIMAAMTVGCGETKACFVADEGCMEQANCRAAVTVVKLADVYYFEMRALQGRYISVALSTDTIMGDDAVVECVYDNVTLTVDAFASWNFGHSNRRSPTPLEELGLTFEAGSYVDNALSCAFTREPTTMYNGTEFNLATTPFYIMLAGGNRLKEFGIGRHEPQDRFASTHAQLLHVPGMFDGKGAGAAIVASAWLTLAAFAALFLTSPRELSHL